MNKFMFTGVLIASSLPLLALAAEGTTGMSQSTIEYITKLNCDTFTGDSKTYCLEKKRQVMQNQQSAPQSRGQNGIAPKDGSGSMTERVFRPEGGSGMMNNIPPRDGSGSVAGRPFRPEGGSGMMNGMIPKKDNTAIEYITKLNCDTFSGEAKVYCLEKKKQVAQYQSNSGSEMAINPEKGKGVVPPKPGSGAIDHVLPPNDGISAGVAKLSESDRIELMKMIQSFLESKGIKVILPSERVSQNNNTSERSQNTNTGSSAEEIRAKMNAKRDALKPKKTTPSTTTTNN